LLRPFEETHVGFECILKKWVLAIILLRELPAYRMVGGFWWGRAREENTSYHDRFSLLHNNIPISIAANSTTTPGRQAGSVPVDVVAIVTS
jgi:hypothetical protein